MREPPIEFGGGGTSVSGEMNSMLAGFDGFRRLWDPD